MYTICCLAAASIMPLFREICNRRAISFENMQMIITMETSKDAKSEHRHSQFTSPLYFDKSPTFEMNKKNENKKRDKIFN